MLIGDSLQDRRIIPRGCGEFVAIIPPTTSFSTIKGALLLLSAFEHGTANRLTPAQQPAVGAVQRPSMTRVYESLFLKPARDLLASYSDRSIQHADLSAQIEML
jgi:hypothetical protein